MSRKQRVNRLNIRSASSISMKPVALASALVVAGVGSAWAQDAAQVVVTGIRASIESAISIKKNSDSIVEAVTSEDLGKLPDLQYQAVKTVGVTTTLAGKM